MNVVLVDCVEANLSIFNHIENGKSAIAMISIKLSVVLPLNYDKQVHFCYF